MLLNLILAASAIFVTGEPPGDSEDYDFDQVDAEVTITDESGDSTPTPACVWSSSGATASDVADEQGFWRQIDGGDHYEDVLVFLENGTLRRTFSSTQTTWVFQTRICDDPEDPAHGRVRWTVVGPPNPTVYWDELTERVTRRVPLPAPNLGLTLAPDGSARIPIKLGLWIAVDNPDDVVARAEPAPGIWAETRATLDRIEYLTGTGNTSGTCVGAGTALPTDAGDTVEQGPCGYTYTDVDELGQHTAVLRATWTVTNTTSSGATELRADIVVETLIPIDVFEIQTVGTG